jgi:transcriptional regulator with XRE-family HTH domain
MTGAKALDFGEFLRSRRERISPAQVGFPTSTRRRSQGLRREEVAVLAGLSPTWYSYLEQGRKIRPSQEVLDSLARVLALSEAERRYMYLLALGHPPAPVDAVATPAPKLPWQVVRAIGEGPHPVYLGNQYADVIAWNKAATYCYADFDDLPPEHRNMLWWLLCTAQARERIVNWEEDTRDVVARLRSAYATRTWDPTFKERVEFLSRASADFRRFWGDHDVRDHGSRIRTVNLDGQEIRYHLVTLHLADDHFNSALIHIPIDE